MLKDKENVLFNQISQSYPKSMKIALKVREYVEKNYEKKFRMTN